MGGRVAGGPADRGAEVRAGGDGVVRQAGRYGGEVQDKMTVSSLQRGRSSRSGVPRAAESSGGGTCSVSG